MFKDWKELKIKIGGKRFGMQLSFFGLGRRAR
jgi:hypothetical protein